MIPTAAFPFSVTVSSALLAVLLAGPHPAAAAEALDLPSSVTDGQSVTVEEIRATSAAIFSAFAGPDGGPLLRSEFTSARLPAGILPDSADGQILGKLFELMDLNDDGQVTRAEWNECLSRDLELADQNEDGRITLQELANARENLSFGDALDAVF